MFQSKYMLASMVMYIFRSENGYYELNINSLFRGHVVFYQKGFNLKMLRRYDPQVQVSPVFHFIQLCCFAFIPQTFLFIVFFHLNSLILLNFSCGRLFHITQLLLRAE